MNRLDEVHEEVFPICLDRAILPPRSLNIKARNSLTANENGVVGMDRLAMVGRRGNMIGRGSLGRFQVHCKRGYVGHVFSSLHPECTWYPEVML